MKSNTKLNKDSYIIRFILILTIVLILYVVFVSFSVYRNLLNTNYENQKNSLEVATENISQSLDMVKETTYALSGSESFDNWLDNQTIFVGNTKNAALNIQKLNEEIQRVLTYNNAWKFNLFDYVAIYENDTLLAITYTKPVSIKKIMDNSRTILEEALSKEEYSLSLPPSKEDASIYTTLRVTADFTKDDNLYIVGSTDVSGYNDKLNSLVMYEGTKVYLVDNEGTIFASCDSEGLGEKINIDGINRADEFIEAKIDNIRYLTMKKRVNNEFSIVYMLPKVEVLKQTMYDMRLLLVLSLLVAIFLIAMVIGLTGLLKRSYESNILMREMELKTLQQQMNPHFLFNILLTIQIKAKLSGDEKVQNMIGSLSALLRAGIYGDKRSTISIREELKYVEYYLSLQKERFEERLVYEIEVVDERILDCEIPRLSIEPMVENAVVHGMENAVESAHILIKLKQDGNDIAIEIRDNGIGFDTSDFWTRTDDMKNDRAKTGIKNTNHRLKLLYGDAYGIKIDSTIGKGTIVNILIPASVGE